MPKKILHVIIGLNVGGAELMLKRLILASQKNSQFSHSVISLTDEGVIGKDLKKNGVEVYTLGMQSLSNIPQVFWSLRQLMKKLQPDVVQTWMYHADFIGGLVAKSLGIDNIIWGIRTTDVSQGKSKLTVKLAKICAKLSYFVPTKIVCAANVSKDFHVKLGYDESKMIVIPNGYDLETLKVDEEQRLKLRKDLKLSVDDIVIGSVGRFNPVKNQKFFVDLAHELVKTFPNLKFMIVGRDNDKNNSELTEWIKNYNLESNFRLLGQRGDVPICLSAMDIFCLHSKTEGFPNVLAEGAILGTYVISNEVGDVCQIVDDKNLVELDVRLYGKRIIDIILDEEYLNQDYLSIKSEIITNKFSIENTLNQFYSLYD